MVAGQLISDGETPRRKVMFTPTQHSKKKSPLRSTKNLLSTIFFFFFLKQFSDMRKGRPGKMGSGGGGKGISDMFEGSKTSHLFEQKINVRFNDVVGMQRAK